MTLNNGDKVRVCIHKPTNYFEEGEYIGKDGLFVIVKLYDAFTTDYSYEPFYDWEVEKIEEEYYGIV
tara:strand:- start:596 stop:796 length:201 start_codon:yes stop_codon:yes gene_type:complete